MLFLIMFIAQSLVIKIFITQSFTTIKFEINKGGVKKNTLSSCTSKPNTLCGYHWKRDYITDWLICKLEQDGIDGT